MSSVSTFYSGVHQTFLCYKELFGWLRSSTSWEQKVRLLIPKIGCVVTKRVSRGFFWRVPSWVHSPLFFFLSYTVSLVVVGGRLMTELISSRWKQMKYIISRENFRETRVFKMTIFVLKNNFFFEFVLGNFLKIVL